MSLLRRVIGAVLRRERQRQRRTLREVAHAAGVSVPYLSEVERGRKEASSEVLAAICRALGLHLSDLLEEVRDELRRVERRLPTTGPGHVPVARTGDWSATPTSGVSDGSAHPVAFGFGSDLTAEPAGNGPTVRDWSPTGRARWRCVRRASIAGGVVGSRQAGDAVGLRHPQALMSQRNDHVTLTSR
ncbi:helix-turn-helix transcriptional regulator [Micromonospora sp. HNM0581]|uniref:helix-turn-helix domain-containing protein n=1 Tax=Micromonospora sp. HNM0581 TaxID=2716341 RepID=UPI00146E9E9F|nr:helix-turn-helix transcriptional regulator [Micromonospora sp. HNM0581]NLU80738.1 helix-turn-helix transcriptional regulator [Micromonospora sp. HNM0581]